MDFLGRRRGSAARVLIVLLCAALLGSLAPAAADDRQPPLPDWNSPDPDDIPVDALPGPLLFLTDSVGLGAVEELAAATSDRFEHYGFPGLTVATATAVMNARTAPLGEVAVIALGYNYPHWDPAGFDADIDRLVDRMHELGAQRVVWVNLRRADASNTPRHSYKQLSDVAWYFSRVNDHIEAAVDRHESLSVADWQAVSAVPGLTWDAIHLNPAGQSLMTEVVLDEVARAKRRTGAGTHRFTVSDGDAPSGAVLSVDVSEVRDSGTISVHGCSEGSASTSTKQLVRGGSAVVLAAVPVGRKGRVCVTASDAATINVTLLAKLPVGGGLLVAPNRKAVPGYHLRIDPEAKAQEPIRAFDPVEVADVELAPQKVRRIKAAARGRVPIFSVRITSAESGVLSLHRCGNPSRRAPLARFEAGAERTLTVLGYAKNRTCLSTTGRVRVEVEQVGTIKPSALIPVRPRGLG